MVDMASKKIFQAVLCPTHSSNENWFALSTKTFLATKFPTDFNSTLLCFSANASKLCCIDITFSKMCRTVKKFFYLLWMWFSQAPLCRYRFKFIFRPSDLWQNLKHFYLGLQSRNWILPKLELFAEKFSLLISFQIINNKHKVQPHWSSLILSIYS